MLRKAAARPHFQDNIARIILDVQDADGSWWDYPLYNYHQQYGTGFALMTLHRCRRAAVGIGLGGWAAVRRRK